MNQKRILVAVRLPDGRDAAFEQALTLARATGAELYLLHAVPPHQPFSLHAADRVAHLAELSRRAEAVNVTVRTAEQHGHPADLIALHAKARDVDLIVMGHVTRTAWRPWRTPSLAERVARRSARPVMFVDGDRAVKHAELRHMLVAVDLSDVSRGLVARAWCLLGAHVNRLTVVHAVKGLEAATDVRNPARWLVPEYRRYVLDEAERRLQALVSRIPGDVRLRTRVATGVASDVIVEQANDLDVDIVVVGRTPRLRPFRSTALRTLRHVDRPLLIVPTADIEPEATNDARTAERRAA